MNSELYCGVDLTNTNFGDMNCDEISFVNSVVTDLAQQLIDGGAINRLWLDYVLKFYGYRIGALINGHADGEKQAVEMMAMAMKAATEGMWECATKI